MKKWLDVPQMHRYPSYEGTIEFRRAAAEWYKKRFNVELNPETEVVALIGSKEGIAHLPIGIIDPGDVALVPDPAYPVYSIGVHFAGGKSFLIPLLRENNFLPDLSQIQKNLARDTKLMYLNYPNNPTSATADIEFFKNAVEFARENNIIICHDAAYTEITTSDDFTPPSILEVEGAKERCIEFHTLSKTFNMTGWRIGFAVGNSNLISALKKVKTNIDSGVFTAIQMAGIAALKKYEDVVKKQRKLIKKRRKIFETGLKKLGIDVFSSRATFYVWARIPGKQGTREFADRLLEAGVAVTPGNGFGRYGEGYFRVSLTVDTDILDEALTRIRKVL
jgi:LL-diaminopimelate aminotransferase